MESKKPLDFFRLQCPTKKKVNSQKITTKKNNNQIFFTIYILLYIYCKEYYIYIYYIFLNTISGRNNSFQ